MTHTVTEATTKNVKRRIVRPTLAFLMIYYCIRKNSYGRTATRDVRSVVVGTLYWRYKLENRMNGLGKAVPLRRFERGANLGSRHRHCSSHPHRPQHLGIALAVAPDGPGWPPGTTARTYGSGIRSLPPPVTSSPAQHSPHYASQAALSHLVLTSTTTIAAAGERGLYFLASAATCILQTARRPVGNSMSLTAGMRIPASARRH